VHGERRAALAEVAEPAAAARQGLAAQAVARAGQGHARARRGEQGEALAPAQAQRAPPGAQEPRQAAAHDRKIQRAAAALQRGEVHQLVIEPPAQRARDPHRPHAARLEVI
jgi:hypothetical protein